ncbi:MAG: type II toxin-antitoxin system RelE/ParE family toxin [Casimicrobiaceae bacterium]
MLTVAEVPEYLRRSKGLLSAAEREAVVAYLAANPTAGDLIRETGGVRKLRWARGGRGKSGGVRVIYYYHSDRIPLYLLTIFAKGERTNLSAEERRELAQLTTTLKQLAR